MKNVGQEIFKYIDHQNGCEVITKRGIMISVEEQWILRAEYTYLCSEDASLSVSLRSHMSAFVEALGIKNIQDIYYLTPGHLMETYYQGLGEMVCYVAIAYTYCMSFQKIGPVIVAENERSVKHIIPSNIILEIPHQFITYAKRYYKLMECSES